MFEDFIQEHPIHFAWNSLQDSLVTAQLTQDRKSGKHEVAISSDNPLLFTSDLCSVELKNNDENTKFEVNVNVTKLSAFEIKGLLDRVSYRPNKYCVNRFVYIIPNSGDRHFVHNKLSWVSSLDCKFNMYKEKVEVLLPQTVSATSSMYVELSEHVEGQIKILGTMLTFCRSTTVEWESKYSYHDDNQVAFEYIKARSKESFPNQINPLRRDEASWTAFLLHCMTNELKMESLIESGVYQAIGNLRWTQVIDEWSLIRLVAALEGMVLSKDTLIPESRWKRLRRQFVKQVQVSLSRDTQQDTIDTLSMNINNSDRVINQQSLKSRLKHSMEELNLASYYAQEKDSINAIINSRNNIVHTGWDRHLSDPIWEMIVTMRNANYLLIMRKLNYSGEFWFCLDGTKQSVNKYVQQTI